MTAHPPLTPHKLALLRAIGEGRVRYARGNARLGEHVVTKRANALVKQGLARAGSVTSDGKSISWRYELTESGQALLEASATSTGCSR